MIIELLNCLGCWRVVDQFTMGPGCSNCNSKKFRLVKPSLFNICRWIVSNPKHAYKMYLKDKEERKDEKRV